MEHKSLKEAYSSVGGLNKQIEAIRDLLEIPLQRPELFSYFGMSTPLSFITILNHIKLIFDSFSPNIKV